MIDTKKQHGSRKSGGEKVHSEGERGSALEITTFRRILAPTTTRGISKWCVQVLRLYLFIVGHTRTAVMNPRRELYQATLGRSLEITTEGASERTYFLIILLWSTMERAFPRGTKPLVEYKHIQHLGLLPRI